MYLWLGIRNLERSKSRTLFTIVGIVLSVMLMSVAYYAVVGIARNAYDPARKIFGGDIVILHENVAFEKWKEGRGYYFTDIYSIISESEVRSHSDCDNVVLMYPVLLSECILSFGDEPYWHIVFGVDVEALEEAVHFSDIMTDGRYFKDSKTDKYSTILNDRAWTQLQPVGSTMKLFLPTYEVRDERVVTTFDTGAFHDFETIGHFTLGEKIYFSPPYMPIETLRDFMNAEDTATYMAVLIKDFHQLDETKAELQEKLPGYEVVTVHDMIQVISKDFDRLKTFVSQIIFVVYAVCGLIVLNTMLVSVEERKREIAILKAVGAGRMQISLLFLMEACLYGLLGTAIGFFLGSAISHAVLDMFFVSSYLLLYTFGLVLVVVAAAGVYPAVKAAQQNPMEGLRYG